MDTLTIADVETLWDQQPGWCVSLYMPTQRSGRDVRENPIRLKNLLSKAEDQLAEAGVPRGEISRILEPATREFAQRLQQNRDDGLAIFLSADETRGYRLPEPVQELVVVANRFHVKPLLKLVQQNGRYCLLAVSQKRTRFLEGSRTGLQERPVQDLPESLQEVVGTEHHKGFQLHSFRVRANAGDPAVPHGHVEEAHEEEMDRFFRAINDALSDALQQDRRPLIFAGVDELFPHFRRTTSLTNVLDQHISGNPDGFSDKELHERAWPIVQSLLRRRVDAAVERWNAAEHSELGGKKLEEIIVAAHDGRIETLLLHERFHLWGTYDEQSRKANVEQESTAENYDLSDLAAVRTLSADGRVVFLEDGHQLGTDGMAAIYRYAATSA